MPYNPEIAQRMRQVLSRLSLKDGEVLGEKRMFGGLCFTLNDKMLVGIDKERLVIRLADEDYKRELGAGKVAPMDLTGKPIRNFAFLISGVSDRDEELLYWADLSVKFVRANMLGKSAGRRRK